MIKNINNNMNLKNRIKQLLKQKETILNLHYIFTKNIISVDLIEFDKFLIRMFENNVLTEIYLLNNNGILYIEVCDELYIRLN